ncbi:GH1 family beta-glucosidase [Phytomonospora endophytica]|uniref:Beta-glucosidase n=1 Tax=Phytomonospora endophytica TaxID=714109 RepID=A0A841FN32_9ACTN|nr:GH1 family beta-glucosidase [Phytomonospora endophytica]MBB6038721.1 beta-glucosidase [Phytomonospora endophytica]GIG68483.1 beta-glucosidase [Phytomonospora endophytica]
MEAFPRNFIWGVSTSAYQTEGAVAEDGRTPSVWDTFARVPGAIADGSTGDVATDHYHRWEEDVALLADLGVRAYRFSLSWSRIMPDDSGRPNAAGLEFYESLLDGLSRWAIRPVVNLYHWDLPQWLQEKGGWCDRETTDRFAEYAAVAVDALGRDVDVWCTLNEPFEHCMLGHVLGEHAPGLTLPLDEAFAVAHHLLLAQGKAVRVLREAGAESVMAINSYAPARPASDSEADRTVAALYDVLQNRLFTDPPLTGRYPEELEPLVAPFVRDGDMDVIATPVDLWGVNYYAVNAVRAVDGPIPLEVVAPEGHPLTAFGWAVAPEGLTETLTGLRDRYGDALPVVVVSENGCAYDDVVGADGRCDDPERVAYLSAHLDAIAEAIAKGVDVRGYFVWSLTDNWEWAEGFTKRFGLVHVDYATQERVAKSSFAWYRERIAR